MDGAKLVTDTVEQCLVDKAFCVGRSIFERGCEPRRNENPGDSKIIVELESLPLKGQGLLDNGNQSRVSRC